MSGTLKAAVVGSFAGAVMAVGTGAIAGTAIGGVVNLEARNTVDPQTQLRGKTRGNSQLRVTNEKGTDAAIGVRGSTASTAVNANSMLGRVTSADSAGDSAEVRKLNLGRGVHRSGRVAVRGVGTDLGHWAANLLAGVALLPSAIGSASGAPLHAELGELSLQAALSVRSDPVACPAGTPPEADECFSRTGGGLVPGLGFVSEAYTFIVDTNSPSCVDGDILHASKGTLTVTGKGAIDVLLAGPPKCFLPAEAVLKSKRSFTIIGGTGMYVGASGSGMLQHDLTAGTAGGAGTDSWVGTLVVPGRTFDLTAPVFSGAVNKVVRAPRGKKKARVVYKVTARDDVDGAVPVACRPRSRSLFKLGRTSVKCSTVDASGNTATAAFTVTVRR